MTNPPVAKVFVVTEPEPGKYLVSMVFDPKQDRVTNVRLDGSRDEVVEVTEQQLRILLADVARMAVRWRS